MEASDALPVSISTLTMAEKKNDEEYKVRACIYILNIHLKADNYSGDV